MFLVLPLLYNAIQCLLIRYRLLRSLPATARSFFHLHPNPVGGTVTCSFRSPKLELHGLLDSVKRCRAPVGMQFLPRVELLGLGASWMRLIPAIGLEPQRKRNVQRILVNSTLDVDPLVMDCGWKSFLFLVLGLGVNPSDPVLHNLGKGTDAVNEQNLQSMALRSEAGTKLIGIRWHERAPHLELTEQCSSWSIRRSLAHSLHMIIQCEAKRELLHFVALTNKTGQTPTAQICDCRDIFSNPVDFSVLHNLHFALTWTLYFEELLHPVQRETIFIPQSLLLFQFEITQELRRLPTETFRTRLATIFPESGKVVANIMSALSSIWDSPEHQELLGSSALNPVPRHFQHPQPITSVSSTQLRSHDEDSLDVEKGTKTDKVTNFVSSPEKISSEQNTNDSLNFYPILQSSPIYQSLFSAYSPFAVIAANIRQSSTPLIPATATIDIDDKTKPEALLARLIIAMSTMRHSTVRNGWVTSIASGSLRYKIGTNSGDYMIGKLMKYEGRIVSIE